MRQSFTLVEFIVSAVIIGIIAGLGSLLMLETVDSWVLQKNRKEMSESARISLDRMIREIRLINDNTSVITASANTFQFVNVDGENITFSLSGSILQRTVDGTSNDLADNLSVLSFAYYDSAGAAIVAPIVSPAATDIDRIEIAITFTLGGTNFNIKGQVAPRRL